MSIIFSNAFVLAELAEQPLNHARIGWRTLWRAEGATVAASSSTANSPAIAAANENTYEFWQPTSLPATWTITLEDARTANYVGIAAHNLADSGTTVELQYLEDGEWETALEFIPGTNDPIMGLFEQQESTGFRVRLSGGSGNPRLGVIFIGDVLEMERPFYSGHSPINFSRATTTIPNETVSGNWVGRSVLRRGFETSMNWRHLRFQWYQENFDPFVRYASQGPSTFFVAWNPLQHPDQVGYCWLTTPDVQPSLMGVLNYYQVSINVAGHSLRETITPDSEYS